MKKYVWITGVQGFIGSALSKHLSRHGFIVGGVGSGEWTNKEALEYGVDFFVCAKVTDTALDTLKEKSGVIPDAIYHLAGGSSVGLSIENPQKDFLNTVESTSRLIEWLRKNAPDTHLFYASSAAVYGGEYSGAITESYTTHPYSPYGWHKRMAEMLLESYHESFNLKYTILRLFSVYGEGLHKQLIWDTCKKLANHDAQITFGGTGNELRDWIYIDDVVKVFYQAFEGRLDMPKVLNVASGNFISVSDIVQLVIRCWGEECVYQFSGMSRKGDPMNLVADISLLNKLVMNPEIDLEKGMSNTVLWYKRYLT